MIDAYNQNVHDAGHDPQGLLHLSFTCNDPPNTRQRHSPDDGTIVLRARHDTEASLLGFQSLHGDFGTGACWLSG